MRTRARELAGMEEKHAGFWEKRLTDGDPVERGAKRRRAGSASARPSPSSPDGACSQLVLGLGAAGVSYAIGRLVGVAVAG